MSATLPHASRRRMEVAGTRGLSEALGSGPANQAVLRRSVEPERVAEEAAFEAFRNMLPLRLGRQRSVGEEGDGGGPSDQHHEVEASRLLEELLDVEALAEAPMGD